MNFRKRLERRIDAALGKIPCDLILKNVTYLDVFNLEWKCGSVSIVDGTIVGLEEGLKATRVIDCKHKTLVPGFIDAHVHIESSLMIPTNFSNLVLNKGTTTVISDPHEIANVIGTEGIRFFLDASLKSALDMRVMLSSCVPATDMETNGCGHLKVGELFPLKSHEKALGLAEVMNVPGVLFKEEEVLDKVEAFYDSFLDGHAPLLRGKELSAYASTGISSCHESSELEEAREKLTKGMAVWIREGSVAKDLQALLPLLTSASSSEIGFCTDDRNPLDIFEEGHIDYLVRKSIKTGWDPKIVFRSSSYSVAKHYGLNKEKSRTGAIAPGFNADLVLLNDLNTVSIEKVFRLGLATDEISTTHNKFPSFDNTIKASPPQAKDLKGPSGRVHVIVVKPGKIITDRTVEESNALGVHHLTVLERHGKGGKPSNAYVRGFGENFKGAIASSVGHDSHNLIVVGSSLGDMQIALKALIHSHGGFCVVQNEKVLAELALPFGGLMTDEEPLKIKNKLLALKSASKKTGCELHEPFLQLAFLSLPVIPTLKLTDKGLVDVDKFQLIDVRAS